MITSLFDAPFFTGGAVSSLVPTVYPVALNGRPYMLDTSPETYYVRWNTETIPLLRQQADQSNAPAEASLNPEGLWRRAQDSWHHGAGQSWRDRDQNADVYRFRSSKGIDVWTKYQLGLLNDTTQKKSASGTNLALAVAGSRLYFADGSNLYHTTDMTSWTACTGYTGTTIASMTSDGYQVYICDGANIWTTNTTTSALTSVDTTDATLVRYVKGRLMVGKTNVLYNIPTLGSAATMTFTHPNTQFNWVDCCEGNAVIYAAGYAGDKSTIYRTTILADGTALAIPVAAASLPSGEIVRSIHGYLGYVFIGSDKGVRFCEADASGNLTIGPLIQTNAAVYGFTSQAQYTWFGWTNYDGSSTGLGRLDITQFVDTDQPSYATDLMASTQGAVQSVQTFTNLRVFAVSGHGVYADSGALVSSGTIDMGDVTYGIPDPKTSVYVDVATAALVGSYSVALSVDGGTFTTLGSESTASNTRVAIPTNQRQGDRFEVRLTLTAGATSPYIHRWTLKALPNPTDGPAEILHLPLMLYPSEELRGLEVPFDVLTELREISDLRETREIVTLQYFTETYTGFVSDFKWYPYGLADVPGTGTWSLKGTCLVDFQRIS